MNTERIAIQDLNYGDLFTMLPDATAADVRVCLRKNTNGAQAVIVYRLASVNLKSEMVKPALTDVYRIL